MKDPGYKKKFMLVCLLAIISFGLYYKRALVPVLDMKERVDIASQGSIQLDQLQNTEQVLKRELLGYDALFGTGAADPSEVQQELLNLSSTLCKAHHCKVLGFPGSHEAELDGEHIISNSLEVEGPFPQLVRVAHGLETGLQNTRVVSMRFTKVLDRRSRKHKMTAKIHFQHAQINI